MLAHEPPSAPPIPSIVPSELQPETPCFYSSFLLEMDPRVRPMILFLKEWKSQNKFYLLTSYALILLVWVFLAQLSPPILPTLEELRTNRAKTEEIDGK